MYVHSNEWKYYAFTSNIFIEHACLRIHDNFGRDSVYCSWSTNTPPLILNFFNAYFRLGKG